MPSSNDGTLTNAQNTYLKSLEPDFKAYIMKNSKCNKTTAENTFVVLLAKGTLVRTGVLQAGLAEPTNNAIFTAPAPMTARQIYECKEKDEVLTLADNLKKETEADVKAKYEEAALEQAKNVDVSRNQRDFEAHIGGTLQDLCTKGALGPAEMVLLASFRGANGDLATFVVHAHSDENQWSFADFVPNFSSIRAEWDAFSAEALPNHTWPLDKAYNGLPYNELIKHPEDFYNTERFLFQLMLGTPLQQMSLSQISSLVEYFILISHSDCPFIFRDKETILESPVPHLPPLASLSAQTNGTKSDGGKEAPPPPPSSLIDTNGTESGGGMDSLTPPPPPPPSAPAPANGSSGGEGDGILSTHTNSTNSDGGKEATPPSPSSPVDTNGTKSGGGTDVLTPPPPPPPSAPAPANGSSGGKGDGIPPLFPPPVAPEKKGGQGKKQKAETQLVPEGTEPDPENTSVG
ncbi:hypothetical protein DFH07DRAFT_950042 [Mycena maculata]|uniref:Uncharacterized protein n=1 Tax=Mycena maculata TaxID=230809 RepID=A0AAD7NYY7_9AGAR|nr:hypothetical protein DFH07DRAFT_950042 [Mycena maculata]